MVKWIYQGRDIDEIGVPESAIGFVYIILNKTLGKFYIGKKDMFSKTNPEISKKRYDEYKASGVEVTKTKNKKLSKKGEVVWRYKAKNVVTETNWREYMGSNKELLVDIRAGHEIEKTILEFAFSSSELTYLELEKMIENKVLYDCEAYNSNILGKFFKKVNCG